MAKQQRDSFYDQAALKRIAASLRQHRWTLAVGESVTSGCLQTAFSQAEGATDFFLGGLTAYHLGIKTRLLHMEPIYGGKNDCVNEEAAAQMSLGVQAQFLSTFGIAITGFASLIPGKEFKKPYAYYAIAKDASLIRAGKIETEVKPVCQVQEEFTQSLLSLFDNLLKDISIFDRM